MANSFAGLSPLLFAGARVVPRELTGVTASVNRHFDDKGVAVGSTVTVPIVGVATTAAHTASQTFTIGTDRTTTSAVLTLNQEIKSSWNLTPEQERNLGNGGTADDVLTQTVAQHIRAHVNSIESYVWGVARVAASRATGTAATDPFATDQKPLADALKILLDNGAGNQQIAAAVSTTAGANLRKVSNLFKVNEGGDASMLRTGLLGNLYNFDIRESAAVAAVTKGAMTGALINGTPAVGATTIPFDTGTVNTTGIVAGDVITIAGDTNKYVVKTGTTSTSGNIIIQEPGLLIAPADNAAITVGNTATQNLCFRRDAVVVVARPGLQPEGGGIEQMVVSDPQTGFSTLIYRAVGDGVASWYMRTVYDSFCPNPYAIVQLLG